MTGHVKTFILRSIQIMFMCAAMMALCVSLSASIEMKAIYPSSFYDIMMVEDGIMVTLQQVDNYYANMKVYDAQDPASPQLLSSLYVYYRDPREAKLYRSHVYIPDIWGMCMRRYSLLDPANPVLINEYGINMVGYRDFAFSGDYLLISTQTLGLRVVNIANGYSTPEVGHVVDGNPLFRVWAQGNRAAVLSYNLTTENAVIKLVDFTNPAGPILRGVIDLPDYDYNDKIELAFKQNYLYVDMSYAQTKMYNIGDLNTPVFLGNMEYGLTNTVFIDDYRICVTGGALRVQSLDSPLSPVDIATFDIQSSFYQHLAIDWPFAYLIGEEYGPYAYCLDLSTLTPPESIVDTYDTQFTGTSIAGWQQWLYSRNSIAELSPTGYLVNIQTCPELTALGKVKSDNGLLHAALLGGTGSSLWDIGNAGELQLLCTIPGSTTETYISGNYFFLQNTSSIRCFDISDPINPVFLFSLPGSYSSMVCDGEVFWVTDYSSLKTYSLSDPQLPIMINSLSFGELIFAYPPRMAYRSHHLYLTGFRDEIKVYDVSDVTNPLEVGHVFLQMLHDAIQQTPCFSPEGDLVVSTAIANQLIIYDLTDPSSPEYAEHLNLPYKIKDLYCYQDRFLFKVGTTLYSIQFPQPTGADDLVMPVQPNVINCYPNPFAEAAAILVDLSLLPPIKIQRTDLIIYNIKGQKIRTLSLEPNLKDRQSVVWDGRNERGNPCANGIYFIRLCAEGRSIAMRRITLIKK
ncbi:MAG: hypothetical protein CVU48_05360 [Candidatus Cloacimonetes bacterium HGW-Cloacimonetes-1]|jgi:hypothetical protein|nr:MAG: hypothetical protein CVU48_05360 [Candidatus Cloacimonetes bacterium HGW-Cloacimonetes-1]